MFQTNLAAINAARKQFGANYRDFVNIEKLALREFSIQLRPIPQASGIALETEREGEFCFPLASDQKPADTSAAQAFFASLPRPEPESEESVDLALAQAEADRIANSQASEQKLPSGKLYIRLSSIAKPTKKVWDIADQMIANAAALGLPRPSRAEIQDRCVDMGIATGTARTQYQAWKKANDATLANMEAAAAASKRFNPQ